MRRRRGHIWHLRMHGGCHKSIGATHRRISRVPRCNLHHMGVILILKVEIKLQAIAQISDAIHVEELLKVIVGAMVHAMVVVVPSCRVHHDHTSRHESGVVFGVARSMFGSVRTRRPLAIWCAAKSGALGRRLRLAHSTRLKLSLSSVAARSKQWGGRCRWWSKRLQSSRCFSGGGTDWWSRLDICLLGRLPLGGWLGADV